MQKVNSYPVATLYANMKQADSFKIFLAKTEEIKIDFFKLSPEDFKEITDSESSENQNLEFFEEMRLVMCESFEKTSEMMYQQCQRNDPKKSMDQLYESYAKFNFKGKKPDSKQIKSWGSLPAI